MTRHKDRVAWERLGNKDAQRKVVMTEVDIRMNAELKEAIGKAIMSKKVHNAWNKCQQVMRELDKGMACIQRRQELVMPAKNKERRLSKRWGCLEGVHKRLTNALQMERVICVLHEDDEGPTLHYRARVCALRNLCYPYQDEPPRPQAVHQFDYNPPTATGVSTDTLRSSSCKHDSSATGSTRS